MPEASVFAGLPDSFESEGYDRSHMRLPDCQNRLIREILAVQPNTIIVLHNGSPVEMPWLTDVKAVLEAYLGGQAVGEAVIRLLYGKANPSGKLAETLPLKLSDNPSYLNFNEPEHVVYAEGVFVGYRYYDTKEMPVAFPFGHGLSYTSFEYSDLKIEGEKFLSGDRSASVKVSFKVTNTGSLPGKEICQLYVSDPTSKVRRPVRELKGFEKITLQPGEAQIVVIQLDARSFSYYNTDLHAFYAADGTYEIQIGASSRDIRLREAVTLTGAPLLPLKLHLNSTLGELITDPRTRSFGLDLKDRMDRFFGGMDGKEEASPESEGESAESITSSDDEKEDTAVSDEMSLAIVGSMPIRNVLTFGLIDKDELIEKLEAYNRV